MQNAKQVAFSGVFQTENIICNLKAPTRDEALV